MSIELSGTVNLGESYAIKEIENRDQLRQDIVQLESKGRYQFLYAGLGHKSFYSVYGKFETEVKSKSVILIKAAEFIAMTYKGILQLDIHSFDFNIFANEDVPTIRGTNNLSGIRFKLKMEAPKAGLKPINKEINVEVNIETHPFLHLEPIVLPLTYDENFNPTSSPKHCDAIMDNEYFERSGILFTEKNRITNENPRVRNMMDNTEGMAAPWGSCIGGYSRIVLAK